MNRLLPVLIFVLHFFSTSYSQSPRNLSSSEILLGMKKLNVLGSVLYIAAHPDDENTRLITYYSKDRLYRTGYLSITRGDGGQNLIGDEQGIELGLIRTQELLAARRIDGGEQFFTRAYDFGYSKNPDETFSKWDKEKILSDVVWVIRKFRPDVIITRFPVTGEGGHGHHTASAILANEAFVAAGDKKMFPEQLKYVDVWQPKRIAWNTFNFGGRNLTSDDQLKVDAGGYNSLLGKSYGEIAAESRSQHKSQGFGASSSRGEYLEFLKQTGGQVAKNDLMEGVTQTWKRVNGGEKIAVLVDKMITAFKPSHPERSLPALATIHRSIEQLADGYWKTQKLKEVKELMMQCSGLFADAYTTTQYASVSDSLQINFNIINRLDSKSRLKAIKSGQWNLFDTLQRDLYRNASISLKKTIFIDETSHTGQPYWLREKKEDGRYVVGDPQKIGQPDADAAIDVTFLININGIDLNVNVPVRYKHTDPVKGELYQPLVILPPVLVHNEKDLFISKGRDTVEAHLLFKSTATNKDFQITSIEASPARQGSQVLPLSFSLSGKNTARDVKVILPGTDSEYRFHISTSSQQERGAAMSHGNNATIAKDIREIRYDHIPLIHYFEETKIRVVNPDLKIEGTNIGYIPGAGDKVAEALQEMGYNVTLLGEKELLQNDLERFDAIVAGIRAYNTNEWLPSFHGKLMSYVENGGNYIVQYNTNSNAGPLRTRIGPYAFDISRTRVTDENAEMKFINPEHRVLNFPNKITADDFKGWIQERSIYHASNWDKEKYETIFSMADPGETEDEGSLIIGKYGNGNFVYTGLVFFRELPIGVGHRIFANLIAL